MPYYRPLGGGVGEIRFDERKVEHRIYGYLARKSFVAMFGHSDKKTQQQAIKHAKALKKQFSITPPPMERYDV
jgi:putative component of toxin-antitoxin plasmid stabilization module